MDDVALEEVVVAVWLLGGLGFALFAAGACDGVADELGDRGRFRSAPNISGCSMIAIHAEVM